MIFKCDNEYHQFQIDAHGEGIEVGYKALYSTHFDGSVVKCF